MADGISWKECVDRNIITRIPPDMERSAQLLQMAELRLEFWNQEIDERFLTLKIEAYYDIIKELIIAHLYQQGFNCSNHQCLIAYLKEHLDEFDYECEKIEELRKVRSEISYRGFFVSKDYLARNELEFLNIIQKLRQLAS